MWPFMNKYQKLKREEVVMSICELEKREQDLEFGIEEKSKKVAELMEKGKVEKSNEQRIFIAKKINFLKAEKQQDTDRAIYLLYNISLLKKLKDAIDDDIFIKSTKNISLSGLLSDQKNLAKFLNSALNTKVKEENILTNADETFAEVKGSYEKNEAIYGVNKNDDELLAMFETEDGIEDAISDVTILNKKKISSEE